MAARRRYALPGDRYGHLVVVGEAQRDPHRRRQVSVRCDCGEECTVPVHKLRTGTWTPCTCGDTNRPVARRPKRYPDRERLSWNRRRLQAYGLTVDQYLCLLIGQHGVCAVCGRNPDDKRQMHVDHDHTTGLVRGVLCMNCNTALGQLDDDPTRLLALVRYLSHPPAQDYVYGEKAW